MIDESKMQLAISIVSRRLEVESYENNIRNFTIAIEKLNGDWDEDLLPLRGMDPHEAARLCDFSRIGRLAELQHFDQLNHLLKTETIECFKSKSIYAVIDPQLTGSDREEHLAEALIRINTPRSA